MNVDVCDNTNNQPIFFNNESTPDNAGAAYTIVPDTHIPPSGKKQHTKPFYPENMKNMANKDTTDTTPAPDTPTTTPDDASS